MIIFSEITCKADTTDYVAKGLVSGTPYGFSDLAGWTFFEGFLAECKGTSKITVEVETYGYGENDGFGRFDASVEEVAYMLKRQQMNPRFLADRCEKISHHMLSINWEPSEVYWEE